MNEHSHEFNVLYSQDNCVVHSEFPYTLKLLIVSVNCFFLKRGLTGTVRKQKQWTTLVNRVIKHSDSSNNKNRAQQLNQDSGKWTNVSCESRTPTCRFRHMKQNPSTHGREEEKREYGWLTCEKTCTRGDRCWGEKTSPASRPGGRPIELLAGIHGCHWEGSPSEVSPPGFVFLAVLLAAAAGRQPLTW